MRALLKILGKGELTSAASLPSLVVSEALCSALSILSQIFGQTWHRRVVEELYRASRGPTPMKGATLAGVLTKLIEEAGQTRPGLASRFVITRNQIVFRSADRRYVVLILQGENDDDSVRVVWQVTQRQAGTSYISYVVRGNGWAVADWKVAEPCLANLDLLAKTGGEVLGYLEEHKLLPPNSPFQRALEAQVSASASMREQLRAGTNESPAD